LHAHDSDIAEEILNIQRIHEDESNLHFMWARFETNNDVMSDEFLQACKKRRENLREKDRQEKIEREAQIWFPAG